MNRPCASAWRQQCLPGAPPAEEDSREAQTLEKKRPLEEEGDRKGVARELLSDIRLSQATLDLRSFQGGR